MAIPDVVERRAAIAGLRDRMAALGGTSNARPQPSRGPRDPVPPDGAQRAEVLGFYPEENRAGTAFVRRVSVNLQPYWDRADVAAGTQPQRLFRLAHPRSAQAVPANVRGLGAAVLDIETLGLRGSGVLAFLVGFAVERGSHLQVEQVLLVDPGAEAPFLEAVLTRVANTGLLVTYNGRCFDIPVLVARSIINRLDGSVLTEAAHCDLLTPVRRLFRDRLSTCTLRRAEEALLGHHRCDDVPGFEAPGRYRAWLRGDGAATMSGVVMHNHLDLCMTAVLGARLAAHVDGRWVAPVHVADRYSLGIYLERSDADRGDIVDEHLRHAFETGMDPWARRAGHRLARRLVRQSPSRRDQAEDIWRRLWADRTDMVAARALAISFERRGLLAEALDICRRVREVSTGTSSGAVDQRWVRSLWTEEWQRRQHRLETRVHRRYSAERALEWAAWMIPPRLPARR